MKRLVEYLREQMIIDFQGSLDAAACRSLLEGDDGAVAAALRAKLAQDRDVNDLMIVIADCLLDRVQRALPDDAFEEQLAIYAGF